MSTITTKNADDSKHHCAACGDSNGGGGSLKACAGCNLVEYCNRTCQVAHWPAHKKACKERAAELFDEKLFNQFGVMRLSRALDFSRSKLSDDKLFKQPPPNEDCPICYLRLPIDLDQSMYQSCCGKILCLGCVHAHRVAAKCLFCRTETSSSDEVLIERMKKRVEANDAQAMFHLGNDYHYGTSGLRQDHAKALKLFHKSAKLGSPFAHNNLSSYYQGGGIVEKDRSKVTHHGQLAAMAGHLKARYYLGCDEKNAFNTYRAYKHWMISANDGCDSSMKAVQEGYKSGFVTKDDYAKTIRAHGKSIDDTKSDDRDRYVAFRASRAMGAVRRDNL
jgi:TPR repeat protein